MYESLLSLEFIDDVIHLPQIDSTNSFAKKVSLPKKNNISVIISDVQTAGRGQRKRTFFSSVKGGLWVSMLVPIKNLADHFQINRSISLAIVKTLNTVIPHIDIKIKWPNDIYVNNKKICGILLETYPKINDYIIIGFGLNVNIKLNQFDKKLQSIATSLYIQTNELMNLEVLLYSIIQNFHNNLSYDNLKIHKEYCKKLFRLKSMVTINEENGIFDGVDIDGRIRIITNNKLQRITSGSLIFID